MSAQIVTAIDSLWRMKTDSICSLFDGVTAVAFRIAVANADDVEFTNLKDGEVVHKVNRPCLIHGP